MADYIKRTDVMKICENYSEHCFNSSDANGQDIADRILDDVVEIPAADVVEVKQIEIIRDDLKWWLETNSEAGVVHIPKFVLENMIKKMTRTPQKEG